MLETVFDPGVRAKYIALGDEDRAELDRVLQLLESDPEADNLVKFTAIFQGHSVGLYDDGQWEIAYRILDDRFLEVVGFTQLSV